MRSSSDPQRNRRLALLLGFGAALIGLLWRERPEPPLRRSLATPFQLLGTPLHLVDRLASQVLPVGDMWDDAISGTVAAWGSGS